MSTSASPLPPPFQPPEALDVESVWGGFWTALQWQNGFAFLALFGGGREMRVMQDRLRAALVVRTLPLEVIEPSESETAVGSVLAAIERPAEGAESRAPLWIALHGQTDSMGKTDWRRARTEVILRLNERRGALQRQFARPLILSLPAGWQQPLRELAIDLWHVRAYSGHLRAALSESGATKSAAPTEANAAWDGHWTAEDQARLAGPVEATVSVFAYGSFLSRALSVGQLELAAQRARELVAMARNRVHADPENPSILRDVSIALIKVGDVERVLNRWEEARAAYLECLTLSRKLLAQVGETPEALRLLSVSLNRVGNVERALNRWEEASMAYDGSRKILQRIHRTVPSKRSLADLVNSQENLAQLKKLREEAGA